jgi:hypothetical protein
MERYLLRLGTYLCSRPLRSRAVVLVVRRGALGEDGLQPSPSLVLARFKESSESRRVLARRLCLCSRRLVDRISSDDRTHPRRRPASGGLSISELIVVVVRSGRPPLRRCTFYFTLLCELFSKHARGQNARSELQNISFLAIEKENSKRWITRLVCR